MRDTVDGINEAAWERAMQKSAAPDYDVAKMQNDLAMKGWLAIDLARKAGVSPMAVSRFLRREQQTARMAKKLAKALGYSIRRYLRPVSTETAA